LIRLASSRSASVSVAVETNSREAVAANHALYAGVIAGQTTIGPMPPDILRSGIGSTPRSIIVNAPERAAPL
jgi:hypothetical protein